MGLGAEIPRPRLCWAFECIISMSGHPVRAAPLALPAGSLRWWPGGDRAGRALVLHQQTSRVSETLQFLLLFLSSPAAVTPVAQQQLVVLLLLGTSIAALLHFHPLRSPVQPGQRFLTVSLLKLEHPGKTLGAVATKSKTATGFRTGGVTDVQIGISVEIVTADFF